MIRGDRPVHETEEIEITPEMIEAGVRAYMESRWEDDVIVGAERTVREVFLAMQGAARIGIQL